MKASWVTLLRMSRSKSRFSVFVATPHCCWEEDEPHFKHPDTLLLLWFVELQAGIHVVLEEANLHEIEVIFIRTNIRKLNTALNKDLYTHAPQCERVASEIHDYLNYNASNFLPPTELRSVFLSIDEQASARGIKSLLGLHRSPSRRV